MNRVYQKTESASLLRSKIEDAFGKGEMEGAVKFSNQMDALQMKLLAQHKDEQSKRKAV